MASQSEKFRSERRWAAVLSALCALIFAACSGLPALSPKPSMAAQEVTAPEAAEKLSYDWAPALLYDVINSPNPEAADALYDAVFAAGPAVVPDLEAALRDDRTAEFAAQSLAFIGGEEALTALSKLVRDPRNLDLRRFYYGALGEFDTPQANQVLLDVIRNANNEPDRTVTEAAIVALTARSDPALVAPLQQVKTGLTDPVIQDDLENSIAIIQSRARYLASLPGKEAGGSIQRAVRVYFLPALKSASPSHAARRNREPSRAQTAAPHTQVEIRHLELSPDKTRALAQVSFKDRAAIAHYEIVLQKQYGDWEVASVWLGAEEERSSS